MVLFRTRDMIARSDPKTYNVLVLRHGTLRRIDCTADVVYRPGDLHIIDSSLPFRLDADDTNVVSCIGVTAPKAMLPVPVDRMR
nr:hypothetical protein [Saccharomonospora xinjiangensis]